MILFGKSITSRETGIIHRVYGAADPNSGTATLLELAKGLGKLYTEHNWRPLRTIYLLSWSGEEYGLLGSTGWAELNAPLIHRALAYLNCDTVVSGGIVITIISVVVEKCHGGFE
jgi:N-acetylated-alpha-linked acidic dipeptidase